MEPNDIKLVWEELVIVKRRNQPVEEGKLCCQLDMCSVFWMMRPNMEAKRLLGIMKDSSIQEGSERKERRHKTVCGKKALFESRGIWELSFSVHG